MLRVSTVHAEMGCGGPSRTFDIPTIAPNARKFLALPREGTPFQLESRKKFEAAAKMFMLVQTQQHNSGS